MRYYSDWRAASLSGVHKGVYFPATVPGNVQKDYAEYFGLGDINYSDNYLKFEELEGSFFNYKTSISKDRIEGNFERIYFVTDGVEYEYDVLIDDEKLSHHEGMYTRTELDLTDILSDGADHLLEILIYPHPKLEGAPWGRSEASQCCKPAVEYDWDWHPRMLVSGIFGDTYFEGRDSKDIAEAELRYVLDEDRTEALVTIDAHSYGNLWHGSIDEFIYTVRDAEGKIVYSGDEACFTLKNIKLWWCNGMGEPYLYQYLVKSRTDDAIQYAGTVGFRTVRLVMNEGAWEEPANFPKSRSAAPIQIELNGLKVFGKGSNWVNPEIYTSNITDKRYETLLRYAYEANMNILRVWGGAIINRDVFFDICDRLGIMVWQEFPLACNNYEGTPHYLEILSQEAKSIIKRIRRHACHVIWCGGNELFNVWSGMTDQSKALRLLNKLCFEMDEDKPFIATAPLEGMGHGQYVIYDYRQQKLVHKLFGEARCTAYSEFGVPSIADMDILKATIPEDDFDNIAPGTIWEKRKGLGVWPEGGDDAWSCFNIVNMFFGRQESLEDYIRLTQWMQNEGLQFIFEEGRRQKPYCSLVMNWDFTEPWNNVAGHGLIAYPDRPKKAYAKVANSLKNVVPSARTYELVYHGGDILRAELWMLNDSMEEVSDVIDAYLCIEGKKEHIGSWATGNVKPNTNKRGHMLQVELPDIDSQFITLCLESRAGANEYQFFIKKKIDTIRDNNALNA